jgi:hypothetical protein
MSMSSEVYFVDGCVIEDDFTYVAGGLEEVDPDEYSHSRVYVYDAQSAHPIKWAYHDINANVVSVCVQKAAPQGRYLCSLSKEGEVEFYNNGDGSSFQEKIPDAGARLGTGGYVTQLREIGATLFVCGQHGQVYRRSPRGWEHCDQDLFNVPLGFDSDAVMLSSIDGFNENDVYVAGDDGKIFHFDGSRWTRVETGCDEHLNWIRCYGKNEVWACGHNGALLKGNAQHGFRDVSGVDDNFTFHSLAKYQGLVYLTTWDHGLFVFDGMSIAPVDTGLSPALETFRLDCAGEVLWSFGVKDVASFDGKRWTRLQHPDNPPI